MDSLRCLRADAKSMHGRSMVEASNALQVLIPRNHLLALPTLPPHSKSGARFDEIPANHVFGKREDPDLSSCPRSRSRIHLGGFTDLDCVGVRSLSPGICDFAVMSPKYTPEQIRPHPSPASIVLLAYTIQPHLISLLFVCLLPYIHTDSTFFLNSTIFPLLFCPVPNHLFFILRHSYLAFLPQSDFPSFLFFIHLFHVVFSKAVHRLDRIRWYPDYVTLSAFFIFGS